MRLMTILATTLAAGGILAAPLPANAAAYTFTQIDVPGANPDATIASGINDRGQIIGSFVAGSTEHGFLDTGGAFTTIDVPGSLGTEPRGINNTGQIVGGFVAGHTVRGFLYNGGSVTTIDVPGATATFPMGINNAGQIVGTFNVAGSINPRGFLYTGGGFTTIELPGSSITQPQGINDAGDIVVYNGVDSFLNTGGQFIAIDVPGASSTDAFGINDRGQIVGGVFLDSTGEHGFLDTGGTFTTIDVPGASFTEGRGINDAGQIVGRFGFIFARDHGFLATPVPEPSSLALFSIGLALFGISALLLPLLFQGEPHLRPEAPASRGEIGAHHPAVRAGAGPRRHRRRCCGVPARPL